MRRPSLSALLVSVLVSGFVACGGKVAFDGQPSQSTSSTGGHGGATSSTSSVFDGPGGITTSTTTTSMVSTSVVVGVTSTSSGMTCDCSSVCTKLAACGIPQQQCLNFCPQAGQMTLDCLCNLPASCQGFQQCLGTGPGSSTGTGGMQGMKLPKVCRDCVNQAAQGSCQSEAAGCFQNQECQAILDCHKQCGWGGPCVDQCDNQHPMGLADFTAFINCGACQQCPMECGNSALNDYCPKPP